MNNREIKFRVFDKLNDRWKFFDLDVEELGHIHHLQGLGGELENLCQFTGLKDKNGKEVYFGDIVEYEELPFTQSEGPLPKHKVIIEDNIQFRETRLGWSWGIDLSFKGFQPIKVIGNIYENPELI